MVHGKFQRNPWKNSCIVCPTWLRGNIWKKIIKYQNKESDIDKSHRAYGHFWDLVLCRKVSSLTLQWCLIKFIEEGSTGHYFPTASMDVCPCHQQTVVRATTARLFTSWSLFEFSSTIFFLFSLQHNFRKFPKIFL